MNRLMGLLQGPQAGDIVTNGDGFCPHKADKEYGSSCRSTPSS